jgi:sec-independent protein translocase protein TatC
MGLLDRFLRSREEGDTEEVKPFLDHLEDLRWMLLKMMATLAAGMVLSFGFRAQLVAVVQKPLRDIDPNLVANLMVLGVTDSFTISFQIAFFAGIILTFPFLLFFAAEFVLPALTRSEKRYLIPGILAGVGLFLTGVCFCYYGLLPAALRFFFKDAQMMQWTPMWTVREYFAFVTQFTIALGLAFELPVAVLVLVKLGFLSHAVMVKTRIFAVVLILGFAAVVSPTPDPFTFLAFGLPMWAMYEACIAIARIVEKRRERRLSDPVPPQ